MQDPFAGEVVRVSSSILERVQAVVAEQLGVDPSEVTLDAEFVKDLNADSLDLVELIMQLEEEFGIEISDEEAANIVTVRDAINFIEEHLNKQ
ncbi:acyl carrier protein [Thermomicrobium sp. CFH 73360]|mgnify:FL=1|uniref:Acyl carrier protein n=1 Tax=Thermomicrobium roseum TaxID=500 RepID=A0A7C1K0L3_THERO|nr:acyl carrier protein [Thermomicrobium sp. CFH 73360]MCM8746023.1 acyl carrier protein [Thermomicrobium sp. CFH 73360]GBD20137.1 Acyl carrier protein [bacterium HR28]